MYSTIAFSLLDTPAELRLEPAFLLYTADFSRIQRFIYTVHTEGALRSLRSRSFFLELLMEHYMDELLDGCGLTRTNIIYSGGGHCYLLLPNTATVQQTLADWNRAFNGWLNEQFGVQLFLANGWTPCSANDLCNVPAEASPYKATPRQIERVIAGSRFGINIVYNLSDPKEMEEDLSLLSKAMKLLQLDYLGGHGSRGNGRVSFQNFQVIPYPETLNVDLDGIRQTFKTEVEEYELFSAKAGV